MKRALLALAVLALAGAGAWGLGAWSSHRVTTAWLDARAAEGWLVNTDGVAVRGFPSRFETVISGLELADPASGWVWTAPRVALSHAVFRPDRWQAVLPAEQGLASPRERLTIRAATFASDLDLQPTAAFALDASETRLADLRIDSSAGWQMALPEGGLSVRRVAGTARDYDIAFAATGTVLPRPVALRLDPAGLLPAAVERLAVEMRAGFDAPWDLAAIEVRRPQPTRLEIAEIAASWGELVFRATGTLDIAPGGLPSGEIAVRAQNWRAMVEMAVNAGALPPRLRGSVEAVLGVVAGLSGRAEDIDATLAMRDGRVFLGPVPLGPAPRFVLR